MTQYEARIYVLSHEITVLRGLRIGSNISVAEAAVQREREVEREIDAARKLVVNQAELFNVTEDDEEPLAVNLAAQPAKKKEGQ